MCLAQCQTEDWHLMKWLLKKKKKVFLLRVAVGRGIGAEIHSSAEGSWLASKEYFSLSKDCSAWNSALLELSLSDTFLNHLSS